MSNRPNASIVMPRGDANAASSRCIPCPDSLDGSEPAKCVAIASSGIGIPWGNAAIGVTYPISVTSFSSLFGTGARVRTRRAPCSITSNRPSSVGAMSIGSVKRDSTASSPDSMRPPAIPAIVRITPNRSTRRISHEDCAACIHGHALGPIEFSIDGSAPVTTSSCPTTTSNDRPDQPILTRNTANSISCKLGY